MKVTASARARVATDRLWQAISTPGYLESCHPFCERNDVVSWVADDRRDHIRYYSGLGFDRIAVQWSPPVGFQLDVGLPGRPDPNRVHWDFEDAGDGTRVTITIHRSPTIATDPEILAPYLESVLGGLAHFVETGTPVTKNQFGSNPLFSP